VGKSNDSKGETASESARLAAKQIMGDEDSDAWFKERLECLDDRRHLVPSLSFQ
jgi:hypothetical protein